MVEFQSQAKGAATSDALLEVTGLTKRFTGTLALDNIDFDVRRGEVHALLGQNGAGKSTLIKILAGVYQADAGEIRFEDRPVRPGIDPLPISFIHQDLGLVDWMTVAENVAVQTGYPRGRLGMVSWHKVRRAAIDALSAMGSDINPDVAVSTLAAAERSLVAIGRALAVKSDILVLDEPTAALPEADVSRLLDALRRLRASGIGIIYVTHRLDEVFRIADRVTVLRDGRRVATAPVAETSPADLVEKIVGRSMTAAFVEPAPSSDRVVFAVDKVVAQHVGPVSFAVKAGETLGLVGLRGAGHHTIGRAIFGQVKMSAGHISLDDRRVDPADPADAMRHQIGFVSSRRAEESLAANMSVRENIYINPVATGKRVLQPVWRRRRTLRFSRRPRPLLGQAQGSRGGDRHAERRQSAKGRSRPLDGGEGASARARGADHRRRRRLQGGNLSPHAAVPESGACGSAAFIRFRRSGACLPSRARVQSR